MTSGTVGAKPHQATIEEVGAEIALRRSRADAWGRAVNQCWLTGEVANFSDLLLQTQLRLSREATGNAALQD
jgi:hypothetical protein